MDARDYGISTISTFFGPVESLESLLYLNFYVFFFSMVFPYWKMIDANLMYHIMNSCSRFFWFLYFQRFFFYMFTVSLISTSFCCPSPVGHHPLPRAVASSKGRTKSDSSRVRKTAQRWPEIYGESLMVYLWLSTSMVYPLVN